MNAPFSATELLAISLRVCAVGIAVQSLEVLSHGRELAPGRLLGWTSAGGADWRARSRTLINGGPGSVALLGARAAFAMACALLPWESAATFGCVGALLVLQLGYNRRFAMLAGNCETMFLVELFALWAASFPEASERLRAGALLFVAAHAALAYLVAGLHKAAAAPWRCGARLSQIALHGSYDLPRFVTRAVGRPGSARAASWAVIVLELLLPVAPFLPPALFWPLLAAGFAFHTLVAIAFGLHGFWWAFAAAYPGLVFVHQSLR